jgi:hypothetical protein
VEGVPVNGSNFETSVSSKYLTRMRHLKLLKGGYEGGRFDMGYATLALKVNLYLAVVV